MNQQQFGGEQLGLAAIIGAAGTLLGRLWGTYREREDSQAAERAEVIQEYQRLLDVCRTALDDSESKRRAVEEQVISLLAAQAEQAGRITVLERELQRLQKELEEQS
ncbi:MAG: hypothetical protein WC314_19955 [Vulcanimicrobiota bacterium]